MRKLLWASAAIAFATLPSLAQADVVINGWTYLDPPILHVTSSVATGSDPVLLNNNKTFSIQDTSNTNISQPITILIATPTNAAAPTITGVTYTSPSNLTSVVLGTTQVSSVTGLTGSFPGTFTIGNGSGQDLYSAVGCTGCDASINQTNVDAAYATIGLSGSTSSLKVYAFSVPQDLVGKDEINVTGTFANGSIILPFAENVDTKNKSTTVFDTQWTNAGLVDCAPGNTLPGCGTVSPPPPPPPPPVPEPASLALLGVGLAGLGFIRRRKGGAN